MTITKPTFAIAKTSISINLPLPNRLGCFLLLLALAPFGALACDAPAESFCVDYFNDRTMTGAPVFSTTETVIDHTWQGSSPDPSIAIYNFSGYWHGRFNFPGGDVIFKAVADDGVRLFVDGQIAIDGWKNQSATAYQATVTLTAGEHLIEIQYYQAYGSAAIQSGWSLVAPPQTSPPTPIGSNKLSPIGTNLSAWRDWGTEQPFINLFKTSRNWITQASGVWDTGEEQYLDLDQNGWVRSLPDASTTNVSFRTVSTILLGGPDQAKIRTSGSYVVLYDGEGSLAYGMAATKIAALSSLGRDVISVDNKDTTGILISIASTDPNHTGNYIRNIRVVPPGVACNDDALAFCLTASDPACQRNTCGSLESVASNRLFHPQFLRNLVRYRALRFMAPLNTNVISSALPQPVDWSNRATLDNARWNTQAGIPAEVAVALSNQLQAEPWLNMPHQASDDYIRQFARLTLNTLDPNRKVYVEYANEIWNTAFSAGTWVEQQGLAAWPNTPDSAYTKRINWYGKRTAETCDIWKSEWAGQESRVVCVLSAQAANSWTARAALDCKLWNQAPCQSHGINAIAIAPYFGYYLGNASTSAEVASWTASTDGGLGRLFAELDSGGQLTGGPAGGALALSAQWSADYANLAQTRGLLLLAYEGGQHLVGAGSAQTDPNITSLFTTANRDPRMGNEYLKMLQNWAGLGGGLFMNYSSVGQYGSHGSWGALENMAQTTSPKYDALMQFIQQNPK